MRYAVSDEETKTNHYFQRQELKDKGWTFYKSHACLNTTVKQTSSWPGGKRLDLTFCYIPRLTFYSRVLLGKVEMEPFLITESPLMWKNEFAKEDAAGEGIRSASKVYSTKAMPFDKVFQRGRGAVAYVNSTLFDFYQRYDCMQIPTVLQLELYFQYAYQYILYTPYAKINGRRRYSMFARDGFIVLTGGGLLAYSKYTPFVSAYYMVKPVSESFLEHVGYLS